MIAYFKDRNHKSGKKYKKCTTLTRILKSFDTFEINATTSSSISFTLTRIGLLAIPISTASAYGLSIGKKTMNENKKINTINTNNNKKLNLSIT